MKKTKCMGMQRKQFKIRSNSNYITTDRNVNWITELISMGLILWEENKNCLNFFSSRHEEIRRDLVALQIKNSIITVNLFN